MQTAAPREGSFRPSRPKVKRERSSHCRNSTNYALLPLLTTVVPARTKYQTNEQTCLPEQSNITIYAVEDLTRDGTSRDEPRTAGCWGYRGGEVFTGEFGDAGQKRVSREFRRYAWAGVNGWCCPKLRLHLGLLRIRAKRRVLTSYLKQELFITAAQQLSARQRKKRGLR